MAKSNNKQKKRSVISDKNISTGSTSSFVNTDNRNTNSDCVRNKNKDDDDDNIQQHQQEEYSATNENVPITAEGERPQKKFYRQRAHCNPLAHNDTFVYPIHPYDIDWTINHYPAYNDSKHSNSGTAVSTITTAATTTTSTTSASSSYFQPTVLDIGCGFGGLTLALASLLPNEIILGMEIRAKVTEYVRLRIVNARKEYQQFYEQQQQQKQINEVTASVSVSASDSASTTPITSGTDPNLQTTAATATGTTTSNITIDPNAKIEHKLYYHHYNNCSVLRTNSMKFLPNYFYPHSINKLFICFPDPHFKRKNHPRRIITVRLLTEYAYILQKGTGMLYCITDVFELHEWHIAACNEHPLFEPIIISTSTSTATTSTTTTSSDDPCIVAMMKETEESKKVDRNKGSKYYAVYRRISDEEVNDSIRKKQKCSLNSTNFFL